MAREIKFRAWDTHTKGFIPWGDAYEYNAAFNSDGSMYLQYESTSCPDGQIILQQFTGLHDKNGVEIYEGDVIEDDFYGRAPIEFVDNGYWLTDKTGKHHLPNEERREIIGNKWENPELLTQ